MKLTILLLILAAFANGQQYSFPDDFSFGVATASYQVEGAWNLSGKGENIWDRLTHSTDRVLDGSTGDVACDAYHKTESDVQLLKDMGVNFYRFSISWSRILPTGYVEEINPDGVRYYNELIDTLLENDIEPLVTMFHWDLPQNIQEIGGWPNAWITDLFADYANVLYANFGDRVKNWITFNEPPAICAGYSGLLGAPGYEQAGIGDYLCAHNLLISHGKAYQLYNERYRDTQEGRVGITLNTLWYEPAEDTEEDIEAADRIMRMIFGIYIHPIYSTTGDYPPVLRERVDALSAEQGYARSRLPYFSQDDIDMIQGSSDFLGLNFYTSNLCSFSTYDLLPPSQMADTGVVCFQSDEWETSGSSWLTVTPWGLRRLLNWIKDEYDNPEIVITENGVSDNTGDLNDCRRINFYNQYLETILESIYEDDCNVSGYTAWSFMDNFEWTAGYTEKFGLYYVDFDDDDRPRTPKMSSYIFRNIIETRQVDWDYTPEGFEACEW